MGRQCLVSVNYASMDQDSYLRFVVFSCSNSFKVSGFLCPSTWDIQALEAADANDMRCSVVELFASLSRIMFGSEASIKSVWSKVR